MIIGGSKLMRRWDQGQEESIEGIDVEEDDNDSNKWYNELLNKNKSTPTKNQKRNRLSASSPKPKFKQAQVGDEEEYEETDNHVRSAGQILVITVENFMCHRRFSVNFCKHLNFITGQNGSGKYIYIHL